jgi:uncharacterized protein YacL
MQNPFESGHIKNYVLLYASVVVIMILFFFASTLFNEVEEIDKKVFNTEVKEKPLLEKEEKTQEKKFKLMTTSYQ